MTNTLFNGNKYHYYLDYGTENRDIEEDNLATTTIPEKFVPKHKMFLLIPATPLLIPLALLTGVVTAAYQCTRHFIWGPRFLLSLILIPCSWGIMLTETMTKKAFFKRLEDSIDELILSLFPFWWGRRNSRSVPGIAYKNRTQLHSMRG